MKYKLIQISLIFAITFIACKKEDSVLIDTSLDYDCYESEITYNESDEFQYQRKSFYLNNLIVRVDGSPSYIWNYEYDGQGNVTKVEYEKGDFYLMSYDNLNRCVKSEQFVEDTLYLRTYKFYLDTLLIREHILRKNGDTNNTVNYYYNDDNQIDSVISNSLKIYHTYSLNKHMISKFNDRSFKFFERITTTENGLTTKFEEYHYRDNSELFKSIISTREYDESKNLIKSVLEQFRLNPYGTKYDELRYSYNSMGNTLRRELYNSNENLIQYTDYLYDDGNLVKKQTFDSEGNKIVYTLVDNTCDN